MDNFKQYFTQSIKKNYPREFYVVIAKTDSHYKNISIDTTFAEKSSNPLDKRLDFSAYFLAFIITLAEKGEPFDVIRKICLEVVTEYVKPKNQIQAFIKKIRPTLICTWLGQILIKSLHKRISINANTEGFKANIITDKQETFGLGYGIDILECGICKLFNKHDYSKYASILCEVDEITTGLAGLKLIRTGTIANGAKKCDFRFIKGK